MPNMYPIWINKQVGDVIDIVVCCGDIVVLTSDGIKFYGFSGDVLRTLGRKADKFDIVELSANNYHVYARNEAGNVYEIRGEKYEFRDSNVVKMIGSKMIKASNTYAYSRTTQRAIPIFSGGYLNVYDNGVKQKVDGTWEGVPDGVDITDKVVKIEGEYYLNTDGELKKLDGTVVSKDVINFGKLDYNRRSSPKMLLIGGGSSPDPKLNEYLNAHKVPAGNMSVLSGTGTNRNILNLEEYRVQPDTFHPEVIADGIWYQNDKGISILGSDLRFKKVNGDFDYDYWFSNPCDKDMFIAADATGYLEFANDLIISKSGREYEKI